MSQTIKIPEYPESAPIELGMKDLLYPSLNLLRDGISEFTFSNLFLFRHVYGYSVSALPDGGLILKGTKEGKHFFYAPCKLPPKAVFDDLMKHCDYMKNLSETQVETHRIELESRGYIVHEDRDNFDYLYNRNDLAELTGREYHKKRNLVNGFINAYECEQKPLTSANTEDAVAVLDEWRRAKEIEGDYKAAREGLELFEELGMRGAVYYIENQPVGWCLGEPLAKGTMFAVHFEKACDRFKGIYQFINQAFAQSLPGYFKFINREQDLGNEGLRQAKMTYRPCGFVRKYRVIHPDKLEFEPSEIRAPAECGPGTGHEC